MAINRCFQPGDGLMLLADALALLDAGLAAVAATEAVPLAAAPGRALAEDITALIDVPPHDNSAVDGYAVFFDDLEPEAETILPVTGRAAAGHPLDRPARRGEAVRIFTGALMPEGLDTIMMQEDCRPEGERVAIAPGIERGANRRARGEDFTAGSKVLRRGMRLRPQDLGQAAAAGRIVDRDIDHQRDEQPLNDSQHAVVVALHIAEGSQHGDVRHPGRFGELDLLGANLREQIDLPRLGASQQAARRGRRHLAGVEGRAARSQCLQVFGDRLAHRAVARLAIPGVREHLHIDRILLEALLHDPHIHVQHIFVCNLVAGHIIEAGPDPAVPVPWNTVLAFICGIEEGRSIPEMLGSRIRFAKRYMLRKTLFRVMAGSA